MESEEPLSLRLEPMIEEAEQNGLWFFHHSRLDGIIWFSPKEIRERLRNNKFVGEPRRWKLRMPEERIAQIYQEVVYATEELEQFKERVNRSSP